MSAVAGHRTERFTSERFFACILDANEHRIVEHLRLPGRVQSAWRELSAPTQMFVLRGAGAYEIGRNPEAKRVMAGDLVHVAPHTRHRFVTQAGSELHLMRILDPADGRAPTAAPAGTPFRKVGVLGAGVMGSGIATHYCAYGLPTVLVDLSPGQLDKARAAAHAYLQARGATPSLLTTGSSLDELAGCDLVLEAVYEDLELKREVLRALDLVVEEHAILATNTSSLTIADLSQGLKAHRFIGLHYNNPPITNPVVECVPGPDTDRDVVQTCLSFLASTEKLPVLCKDAAGFALNRQSLPYINEAARCLDDELGTTHAIDEVAVSTLGFRLGPFAIMNLVGTRVMASSILNLSAHGPLYRPAVSVLEKGRANAKWEIVEGPPASEEARKTIARRLRGALFVPAIEILAAGIASREDLEHICTDALGYPKSSVDMMRERGRTECEAIVGETCQRFDMPPVAVDVVFRD